MNGVDLSFDLGMLCRCCDYHSYHLPDIEGLTASQRCRIEEICKLCINAKRTAIHR